MARSARGKVILVGFLARSTPGRSRGDDCVQRAARGLPSQRPPSDGNPSSREQAAPRPQRPPSAGSPSKPGGSWAPSAFWNIASCV